MGRVGAGDRIFGRSDKSWIVEEISGSGSDQAHGDQNYKRNEQAQGELSFLGYEKEGDGEKD